MNETSSGISERKSSRSRALVTDRWAVREWDSTPEPESRVKLERVSAAAVVRATGSGAPGHRSTECKPWRRDPTPSRGSPLSISISWRGVAWTSRPARTDQQSHARVSSCVDSGHLASVFVNLRQKNSRKTEQPDIFNDLKIKHRDRTFLFYFFYFRNENDEKIVHQNNIIYRVKIRHR